MRMRAIAGLAAFSLVFLVLGCCLKPEPKTYARIYIETFHPEGEAEPDTDTRIELYEWGNASARATSTLIDGKFEDLEATNLLSGHYAIRVTGKGAGYSGGPYAIWVLESTRLDAPDPPVFTPGYEATDADDATLPWEGGAFTDVELGTDGYTDRDLLPNGGDIDWLRLTLP